jgi:Tol biopolymer transport system component
MTTTYGLKRAALLTAVAIAAVGTAAGIGSALHRQTPPFIDVTQQSSGDIAGISAWTPEVWGFASSGDVIGNGNVEMSIFQYLHAHRVLGGARGIKQVSCGPFNALKPSVSKKGDLIAFEADGGLCAFAQNNCDSLASPTTGRQIFIYDPKTGQIRQITKCPGDCMNPNLSGNGKSLLFDSTTNLIGNGGIGSVRELYHGDLRRVGTTCPQLPCGTGPANPGLRRLTIGGGQNGSQSFNGKLVAFESRGDLLKTNANPGVQHIYVLNTKRHELRQVTFGTLDARGPAMSQSGRFVAFAQDREFGAGGPVVSQIFLVKIAGKRTFVTQVTNGGFESFGVSMDPKGRRLSFTSSADLLGLGAPGNQIYTYNIKRNELLQITAAPNGATLTESTTAALLGFRSLDDFVGNGNTTPQFFVTNFFRQAPGDFPSPLPGTPTPRPTFPTPTPTRTPVPGAPANIGLALLADAAVNNGDNTLTTVIAATVGDYYGNPVPDGTFVSFSIAHPTGGVIVSNGSTNTDPECDVSGFEAETGIDIINRVGVVHVCLTYPGAQSGTVRTVTARSGGSEARECVGGGRPGAACATDFECEGGTCELLDPGAFASGQFTLPLPTNTCEVNGQPCSDLNPCTVGDVCAGGTDERICVGGSNEGAACTVDAQCPDLKLCFGGTSHGLPCATSFDCPDGGVCQLMSEGSCELVNPPTCQPGTPVECPDDGNACTVDVCNFFTGTCGMPPECPDDGNPCTDNVCDPATGLCGIPNTAPCDDGDLCTTGDVCAGGTCQPGTPLTCVDDGNDCILDICNPDTGTCGVRVEPCGCSAP